MAKSETDTQVVESNAYEFRGAPVPELLSVPARRGLQLTGPAVVLKDWFEVSCDRLVLEFAAIREGLLLFLADGLYPVNWGSEAGGTRSRRQRSEDQPRREFHRDCLKRR